MDTHGPTPVTRQACIVLAGGRSRRFGPTDKALAELDGTPLLARVVDRTSAIADEVIVSCRSPQVDRFERILSSESVEGFVEDRFPEAGPLAGIEAGLNALSSRYTAVVACDMPFVEPAVLGELFEYAKGADAAVPEQAGGQLQPVQAVYHTKAMRDAVSQLFPAGGSIHEALDSLDVCTVPIECFPERSFHNVNDRQDLLAAEQRQSTNW